MYTRSSKFILAASIASLVVAAKADIGNFTQGGPNPTDWTLNGNPASVLAGRPAIVSNELLLTAATNDNASSAFFNTAQGLNNFTASFTYNFLQSTNPGNNPPADGFTFILQNNSLTALGGAGGGLGYVGGSLLNSPNDKSIALAFDIWNGQNNANPRVNRTGFSGTGYNGIVYQVTDPLALAGITLANSAGQTAVAPVNIKIDYNNGVFTRTVTQGATTVVSTQNINLADRGLVSSAFVGFGGGTGGANADQKITNFSLTSGTAPAVAAAATVRTDVPQGGGGVWGIREYLSPTALNNLADAENAIATGNATNVYTSPVVNLYDSGTRGRFRNDGLYKSDTDQTVGLNNAAGNDTVNNIAVIATATMRIPTSGIYTFGVNSDDGFKMTIDGKRFEALAGQFNAAAGATDRTAIGADGTLQYALGRGTNDSIGSIFLPAGDHKIQVLAWEGGGGGATEIYAAPGLRQGFDYTQFSLLGSGGVPARSGVNRVGTTTDWTYKAYTGVANAQEALNIGSGVPGAPGTLLTTATVPTVNFVDPDGANAGGHTPVANFPGGVAGVNEDAFGGYGIMQLTITEPGIYTFAMYTDDDSRFRIAGTATPTVFLPLVGNINGDSFDSDGNGVDDTFGLNNRCCTDHFGHYNLAAGTYNVEASFREGGGGSGFFVYATQGERDNFDANAFQLLGADTAGATWTTAAVAGVQLVPEPGSISLLGLAAVGLVARRRRRSA